MLVSQREAAELGRLLRSLRKPREVTCPNCGKTFTTANGNRYCSPRCRRIAYWRRWAERQTVGAGQGAD